MSDAILRDLRHAVRGLVARPTYAVITVTTLALVIGAATAVLAVVNATLVRPLPFPDGDRVAQLFLMPPGQTEWTARNPLSLGVFLRFRQNLRLVESVEGLWVRERALGGDTEPETVTSRSEVANAPRRPRVRNGRRSPRRRRTAPERVRSHVASQPRL